MTDPSSPLLSGTDEKTYGLDAADIGDALNLLHPSGSDLYILAQIDTTATDTGSGGTDDETQWVRLQVGEFACGAGSNAAPFVVYALGNASLDGPTPDDPTAQTFTISENSTAAGQFTVSVNGPADASGDGSTTRQFQYSDPNGGTYASVYVSGHNGADTITASALGGLGMDGLTVVDGAGDDTIDGPDCMTTLIAGSGGYSFSGPGGGNDDFVFAGGGMLGTSDIDLTEPAVVTLDFSGLGEGINLDLGQSGPQFLNGLVSGSTFARYGV